MLFAHWAVPVGALRPAVPPELPIDTFDGRAWIAVAPFEVTGLRLRGTPALPGLARFAETNVRTYTTLDGRPGVHFLSLDAASRAAVAAARRLYGLPYFLARMTIERSGDTIAYATRRVGGDAALRVRYRPAGPAAEPRPGSLEHFLVERYSLYAVDARGRVRRTDIRHRPWPLQPAAAEIELNTMTAPDGIALPDEAPLLHYAARQDVLVGPPRRLRT
ncbi:MAG: uncharacterized protein QOC78_3604 [Solirubrobacteraceae bacterium]|nr:uncharacterized protein [Solirubrobacteraceae bacterium]